MAKTTGQTEKLMRQKLLYPALHSANHDNFSDNQIHIAFSFPPACSSFLAKMKGVTTVAIAGTGGALYNSIL
eukprot:1655548-Ditylum_brightwellii.AAC.1